MNALQIFQHEKFGQIRTLGDWENPLFCLADVCRALELNPSKVAQRLEKGVLSKHHIQTVGGMQKVNFVNEDGLYDVILDSRKPEARKFRKWITSEVMPAIRKQGIFSTKEILTQLFKSAENALENLCCVYVLEMENGTVKIGYTQNFINRARQISTASGLKIINWCHSEYILQKDARMIESRCHQTFNEFRTLGEFFHISFKDAYEELERHLNISETMNLNA